MAEPLRKFKDSITVEYGSFELADSGLDLQGEELDDECLETIGPGWIRVRCHVNHGSANVWMEAWDAEPPVAQAPWAEAGKGAYLSGSGIVGLHDTDGGRSTDRLVLGPSFFLYGVHAYLVPPAWRADHEFWEDPRTVNVLLRFWPIRDAFDPIPHARPDSWRGTPPSDSAPYRPSTDWPLLRRPLAGAPGENGRCGREENEDEAASAWAGDLWKEAERRVRSRIATELNPGGAPTFTIRREEFAAPWRAAPGLSGRAKGLSEVVTILDEEDGLLTVRDATAAEAARVIAADLTWR
ncbi:hypothetical protein [Sphaerimonospora thailandensis]|uniref:Uncharacterized protein n=1 Tax=Sphaerimonospora thailandensis TaxID=795644 RepID=A0A8J3R5T3_9ACTN|nr:hypothetical protein [Sphaerimonospora thailandensis]GIH69791.1 hypothetical protein Mth01_20440 [Sphaerimonospora thailandensis]